MTAAHTAGGPRLSGPHQSDARASGNPSFQDFVRLAALYLASRRIPIALAALVALAAGLRVAAIWHWDSYGAVQLPLVFETGCAAVVAAAGISPFGDQERSAGSWLPALRLGAALVLVAFAIGALAAAGAGAHLAGGFLGVARNVAGIAGLALICATVLGGGLAWIGPAGYLVVAAYALYAKWHGGGSHTPWIWPARPPADLGSWLCAAAVFTAGMMLITTRGARDGGG